MDLAAKKRRIQNRNTTLFLMVPTAILAKIIQLCFLPDKYFFDSWRMVDMLNNGEKAASGWGGYQTAVDFHKSLNIIHLVDTTQFSIFYGIIFMPLCMFMVSRVKEMGMKEVVFVLMATGVLNIYVFNINKEVPQFLYFFVIYIIISLPINSIIKVLGCSAVFYWESISFRPYYIIMAALVVGVFLLFNLLRKKRKISKCTIVMSVLFCFLLVFVFFYFSSFIAPSDYDEALNVRDGVTNTVDNNGDGGASTAIRNVFVANNNLGIFMINYVINAIRMLAPIELIIKSAGYFPFVVFQFLILFYLFRVLKNIKYLNMKMVVVLSCFVAYYLGSVVFEPDFGSWVRHESTTFPILHLLVLEGVDYEEENYETENA